MFNLIMKFSCGIFLFLLLGGVSFANSDYTEDWVGVPIDMSYDHTNWDNIDYIRSFRDSTGHSVIEDYKYGDDGYIYVKVASDNAFVGTFRYQYDNGGSTSNPIRDGSFKPLGDSDWYNDNNGYNDIPLIPEPSIYVMLLAGLVLLAFIARRRKEMAT